MVLNKFYFDLSKLRSNNLKKKIKIKYGIKLK